MNIDSIYTGFVIDHIGAGKGMTLYKLLGLSKLECPVAMIMNASSKRMGKKDIIKIDGDIDIDMDVIGYVDPDATVNVIREGKLVEKLDITVPTELKNVLFCKNPRCITSTEQELPHIFRLTDEKRRIYRCIYCDTKANN